MNTASAGRLARIARMILALVCAGVVAAARCNDDGPVVFPDPGLLHYLQGPDGRGTREFYCAELAERQRFGSSGNPGFGIRSLEGVQFMLNLQELALPRNRGIGDLSPLAGLTQLERLDLSRTGVEDLSPLAGLVNMVDLNLGYAEVSDISPLADLMHLESLWLQDNEIESIDALAGLINLTSLGLRDNRITDLEPLVGLDSLEVLTVVNNNIGTHGPLEHLTSLKVLQLGSLRYIGEEGFTPVMNLPPPGDTYRISSDIMVEDLSWLAGLNGLTTLGLYSVEVGSADFLESLHNLRTVALRNARVAPEALAVLTSLEKLESVQLDNNWLKDLQPLMEGQRVFTGLTLYWNCLDLAPGGAAMQAIAELESRGTFVDYYPQRPAEQCME